jgi:hypothetical protein
MLAACWYSSSHSSHLTFGMSLFVGSQARQSADVSLWTPFLPQTLMNSDISTSTTLTRATHP